MHVVLLCAAAVAAIGLASCGGEAGGDPACAPGSSCGELAAESDAGPRGMPFEVPSFDRGAFSHELSPAPSSSPPPVGGSGNPAPLGSWKRPFEQ
jgi:hypothetical protein